MSSSLPAEVRALLARERSRRRAAEDWATFLVATLDSYVRASHAYDRRLAESGGLEGARGQCENRHKQLVNHSRTARKMA